MLQSVRMIGDQQDAAVWQVNRKTWIDRTAAALEEAFPQAVDDFRIACHATVRGHWRTVFQAEVRATLAAHDSDGDRREASDRRQGNDRRGANG